MKKPFEILSFLFFDNGFSHSGNEHYKELKEKVLE